MKKRRHSDTITEINSANRSFYAKKRCHCYLNKHKKIKTSTTKNPFLNRMVIIAPSIISFFEQSDRKRDEKYNEYYDFFDFISRINTLSKESRLWIDLSNVVSVKASAILVLYAHIEQIKKRENDPHIIKTTLCKSKVASSLFYGFGIWDLTNESSNKPKYIHKSLPMLRSATTNDKSDEGLREVMEYVQSEIENSGLNENEEAVLAYNAITESISNVGLHAYDGNFFKSKFDNFSESWWIIAHRLKEQLYIAIYDMGAGIPTTIENKPSYRELLEQIKKMLGKYFLIVNDASKIKAAVEYGKSRFSMEEDGQKHGKGLAEAKEFVDSNPRGKLLIYSGTGSYHHTKHEDEKLDCLPFPFEGTLIQWNLHLRDQTDG